MKQILITILFVSISAITGSAQTNVIKISSRSVGWVPTYKWNYTDEIKIDFINHKLFFRKYTDKKYKEIKTPDVEKYIRYFRDSISYTCLDSITKETPFKVEMGFRIEFASGNANNFPYPKFTHAIEFGYPIDTELVLERIIDLYYELKQKSENQR